jgi:hypothetical protein
LTILLLLLLLLALQLLLLLLIIIIIIIISLSVGKYPERFFKMFDALSVLPIVTRWTKSVENKADCAECYATVPAQVMF